jgi:hypothetical protein
LKEGLSPNEVGNSRFSIKDKQYWKTEALYLQTSSILRKKHYTERGETVQVTDDEGRSTVENTPEPEPEHNVIARLIPTNQLARLAVANACGYRSPYHSSFITKTEFRGDIEHCFQLSLSGLPEFSWRIGKGYRWERNLGVDLLLDDADYYGVACCHALLIWDRGGAGFILATGSTRCTINGEDFTNGGRIIPLNNTITLGECAFTLQYTDHKPNQDYCQEASSGETTKDDRPAKRMRMA